MRVGHAYSKCRLSARYRREKTQTGETKMTIDERLDRLTERHEALTQSAELLLRESQEHTRQIGSLREAAAALLQIAQHHERRISGLEEGRQ